jgi:hypothetical protein
VVQDASRTQNRIDKNRNSPLHVMVKITSTENRKRIMEGAREEKSNI